MTINWLIVSTLSTLVISILTLFPFFIMNQRKKNKLEIVNFSFLSKIII